MRVINFNAGPAALPLPVLERTRDELLDFRGTGMSILEMSHRGADFESVLGDAVVRLRRLLQLPGTHEVLFMQGGASLQFALVPLNFLPAGAGADYVVTGAWGEKALKEAQAVGRARAALNCKQDGAFRRVPGPGELQLDPAAAYVHLTSNETIDGVQFHDFPPAGGVPAVCDMSSDFLWQPVDLSPFSLVYAGAQKNVGPSGLVVVVARKEFLARGRKDLPAILRYGTHAEAGSLYNTPNTFGIYLVRHVLEWLEGEGGLSAMEARNRAKAAAVYGAVDGSGGFYRCPVETASRSVMNPVFRTPSEALDAAFVQGAKAAGMVGLKGHRAVGGIRASLYNAVSLEDARALAGFMEAFARQHG